MTVTQSAREYSRRKTGLEMQFMFRRATQHSYGTIATAGHKCASQRRSKLACCASTSLQSALACPVLLSACEHRMAAAGLLGAAPAVGAS